MNVILSFDTEDFVTPEAMDAQLWWAQTLARRGLRGSFQCVAQAVRRLKDQGRTDVIAALAQHEIGYHTRYHSLPPLHPTAVEGLPLADAIAWVLRREIPGFAEVVETFGRTPVSYCPPGDSWTPATLLAMARLGIRVFTGSSLTRPHMYCGLFAIGYDLCLEGYFGPEGRGEDAFRADFAALAGKRGPDGTIVLYSHPTRLVTTRFWDASLYRGREIPLADLPPAPLHTPADQSRNKEQVERLIDWVAAAPGVAFIDHATAWAKAETRRDLAALLRETGLKPGEEGLLPLRDEPSPHAEAQAFLDGFAYRWPIFPERFTGEQTRRQMRQLAWTLTPA